MHGNPEYIRPPGLPQSVVGLSSNGSKQLLAPTHTPPWELLESAFASPPRSSQYRGAIVFAALNTLIR